MRRRDHAHQSEGMPLESSAPQCYDQAGFGGISRDGIRKALASFVWGWLRTEQHNCSLVRMSEAG